MPASYFTLDSGPIPNSDQSNTISKKSPINNIIGLPPVAYDNEMMTNKVLASMPMLEIYPALPETGDTPSNSDEGMKLYGLNTSTGWDTYKKICDSCGIILPSGDKIIRVAFLNEGPISESWNNEYTESMFEQITSTGVPFLKELKYGTGKSNLKEMVGSIRKSMNGDQTPKGAGVVDKAVDMAMGSGLIDTALGAVEWAAGAGENFVKSMPKGNQLANILMGSGMDFPLIWGGSSYAPSYTITVRLVNPNPTDNSLYEERIINPFVRLAALTVPTSDSNGTYTYPLLLKANCPGMFKLNAGAVTSIEVVKGLDGMDIGFHQRPGTIDVRLTFVDLYSSMIAFMNDDANGSDENRPTLAKYVDNLRGTAFFDDPYDVKLPTVTENSVTYGNLNDRSNTLPDSLTLYGDSSNKEVDSIRTDPTDSELNSYNSLADQLQLGDLTNEASCGG